MNRRTPIQWCDYTLNFWEGCTKVSAGCTHCYAAERDKRHMIEPVDHWGKGAPRRRVKSAAANAIAWNKRPWICNCCSKAFTLTDSHEHRHNSIIPTFHRARVFLGSLMDIFDDEVPIEWLADGMDVVRQCAELDFLMVTKRPELFQVRTLEAALWACGYRNGQLFDIPIARTRDELTEFLGGWSKLELTPQNVWLITSTENQEMLEKRVPDLLRIPAVVHGLSCEPLLGPINLNLSTVFALGKHRQQFLGGTEVTDNPTVLRTDGNKINWVIAGGESGPSARPMKVEWMGDIQRQCQEAGVPYFAKQLGGNLSDADLSFCSQASGTSMHDKKGGDPSEWPEDLRVREWPNVDR